MNTSNPDTFQIVSLSRMLDKCGIFGRQHLEILLNSLDLVSFPLEHLSFLRLYKKRLNPLFLQIDINFTYSSQKSFHLNNEQNIIEAQYFLIFKRPVHIYFKFSELIQISSYKLSITLKYEHDQPYIRHSVESAVESAITRL